MNTNMKKYQHFVFCVPKQLLAVSKM